MSEDNFFNGKDKASKLREILGSMRNEIEYENDPRYKMGFDDGYDVGYERAKDEYKKILDSIQTLIKNII